MSHIVSLQTRLHDVSAIRAACKRLGLAEPAQGTATLFSGQASGLLLQLPGWQYPVVIDPLVGSIHFDNYEGRWGELAKLHEFLQLYAVEKAKLEATKRGLTVSEMPLQDGSIKLQIMGGMPA